MVQITWKESSVSIIEIDHGEIPVNTWLSSNPVIFIEHDGNNSITNCRFWIDQKSSSYSGDFTAIADLAELIGWGTESAIHDFGGFVINMDALGSFPGNGWPAYNDKYGDDYSSFYTGRGDSADNGIPLHTNMASVPSMPSNGTIRANCTTWPSFSCRVQVPGDYSLALGVRQFEQKLRFTYTS